ncbi:uncharacterized protein TNCV_1756861 [Trichonephila clavipes]|nr:uncharacterized protein TNCV_1756861 [Trichonephila clavipes]
MKISFNDIVLLTDSTIVLAWIKKDPSVIKPFVKNRVSVIQHLTEVSSWKHVQSQENPADIISRGIDPDKIQDSVLWWYGSSGLQATQWCLLVMSVKSTIMVYIYVNARAKNQVMADLPSDRVNVSRVFGKVGFDYAGPFFIKLYPASEGIVWHLNPPATPHFGILWEAGIKSLKSHLKRVIGNTILTYEEFVTLVTQVESVLNSRALTKISSDPNDSILTPAHFLVGTSLTALPEPDLTNTPINRLNRWQLVQKLTKTFWKKWSNDYLNRLQSRVKWQRGEQQFKENELVLVKDKDFSKLLNWNLAKIIKVHPGKDNIIRVVTLKTNKGTYQRPVNKLVKLPIYE